jgi:hypothetical protein
VELDIVEVVYHVLLNHQVHHLNILNNFFKANKDPQKTKREVEKISKVKLK